MKYQKIPSLSLFIFAIVSIGYIANPVIVQGNNAKLPSIARVTSMTSGDLACYVDLIDDKGKKYEGVFAIFEICEQERTFLNKRVRLSYHKENFNDCQSAEPCGKTKQETAIIRMQLVR